MKIKITRLIFLFLTFLLIPAITFSQSISLEKIVIDTSDKNMTINTTVNFLGIKKIVDFLIKDGTQILYEADVKIERQRKWFFDKKIFEKNINYIISFDPIQNEYVVKGDKDIEAKSLNYILEQIKTLRINVPLWRRKKDIQQYNLIVNFHLKKKVPYWIEKTLFFWSFEITPPVEQVITFSF